MNATTLRRALATTVAALCCLVFAPSWAADAAAAPDTAAVPPAAARIDASLQGLRERSRMVSGLAAEGANVTSWSSGTEIRKVELELLGESGREVRSFYWSGGELVAARRVRVAYGAGTSRGTGASSERVAADHWHVYRKGSPVVLRGQGSADLRREALGLQRQAAVYAGLMQRRQPARECEWTCTADSDAGCTRFACR